MNQESLVALKKESEEHKAAVKQLRMEAQKREQLATAIDVFVAQYEAASNRNSLPHDLSTLTQPEAVYEILRERGPMSKQDLWTECRRRGVKIIPPSLSVVLSKDTRLESNGNGTWKVKE